MHPLLLDGHHLSLKDVESVAHGRPVALGAETRERVVECRATIDAILADNRTVYGVTTGFGELSRVRVDPADSAQLQLNLIRSHAAGVGPALEPLTVRALILMRAATLARAHSGVRPVVVERLLDLLNHNIVPHIPGKGSVGASGDLAPMAHLALVLVGEGQAYYESELVAGHEALSRAGLEPLKLEAKEGLALINGTQVSAAIGILAALEAEQLARLADLAGALSLQVLSGTDKAFDERVHALRPHPGQLASAANLRKLTADSPLIKAHADCDRVQDAYSLRCMPQVHGAARDAIEYAKRVLQIELDAVTDNPIVFENGDVISGGNFHGQPVAVALDLLAIGICELASISERRVARLTNPHTSDLPAFLTENGGLNSGLMMAHVTAAALVSENKVLAHPASVDSIPTSAGKEDHVSMSTHAARKAKEVVDNVRRVLAIELLAAAQAVDLLEPVAPSPATAAVHQAIRGKLSKLTDDRVLAPDIETMCGMMRGGELLAAVVPLLGALE